MIAAIKAEDAEANNAEPYRQHVNDELTAAAKAVPNFTLQIADGAGNVNTQTSQVDNFITQKVDLLLISPFEAAPLTPAITAVMPDNPKSMMGN
jgi:ribose transport system substrate-binding protein